MSESLQEEQGGQLKPTIKKTMTLRSEKSNKGSRSQRTFVDAQGEEKKVDFAFDLNKLDEDSFLNKLSSAVKRVGEYQAHLGTDKDNGREMKLQGGVHPFATVDIQEHFRKPDYKAEKHAIV